MGDNTHALELLVAASNSIKQAQDLAGLADAHNDLANVYFELGQPAEAREHYEAGAEIKQAIGDIYGQGMIANNLGNMLKSTGRCRRGDRQFSTAWRFTNASARCT